MSSIIALAYISWGPDIHMGSGAGRHIEEIRRLSSRMDTMTKESERALAEAQMLYGAHVFARAKVVPDLALSRGEEARSGRCFRVSCSAGLSGSSPPSPGGTTCPALSDGTTTTNPFRPEA